MNVLYRQFALALSLLALGSVAVFYLLDSYPPLLPEHGDVDALESFATDVTSTLDATPKLDWPTAIDRLTAGTDFAIEVLEEPELWLPVEELVKLRENGRTKFESSNGHIVIELFLASKDSVVQVYNARGEWFYIVGNYLIILAALLALAFLITVLVAGPIARRLGELEQLAGKYGEGQWEARSNMAIDEPIGVVGQHMEAMADNISRVLQDKDHLVDDQQHLLNAVAHEFRGPLSRLRFALDMSQNTDPVSLAENQHEMSQALEELNGLVSEVLQFGRLSMGTGDKTVMRARLRSAAELALRRCTDIPETLTVSLQDELSDLVLTIEPHLLERALGNLLGNACKYAESTVDMSWSLSGNNAVIVIEDDGAGIPERERERVLQPFTRLDTSRTRATGGHGLGLAIVARIARGVEGELSIGESASGGARVRLVLPLAHPA